MQEYQSYLERIRIQEGAARCREQFERVCKQSRTRRSALLNDKGLTFPTLYVLYPSIKPRRPYLSLNQRNRQLVHILSEIERDENGDGKISILSQKQRITQSSLMWALKTGYQYEGDDNYDLVLDTMACVVLRTYGDKEALPYVEHLIFKRNRMGKNIHDLVWAYFHIRDTDILKRMSEHLRADDPLEAELAQELLDTEDICGGCEDQQSVYVTYQKWLEENDPYLFFLRRKTSCFPGNRRSAGWIRRGNICKSGWKNTNRSRSSP